MDYNLIWIFSLLGFSFLGILVYKYYKDQEFYIRMTRYRIYGLIFFTWFYRIFVDYHHRCVWQRYTKFIKQNPGYLELNNDKENEIKIKQKKLKKFFWWFQIKYMNELDKNVWIMKYELENYRLKIKNVPLNSFMRIHKNYKEIVNAPDNEFIMFFIEFLSRKPFDYIEKISVISSLSIENNPSLNICIGDSKRN